MDQSQEERFENLSDDQTRRLGKHQVMLSVSLASVPVGTDPETRPLRQIPASHIPFVSQEETLRKAYTDELLPKGYRSFIGNDFEVKPGTDPFTPYDEALQESKGESPQQFVLNFKPFLAGCYVPNIAMAAVKYGALLGKEHGTTYLESRKCLHSRLQDHKSPPSAWFPLNGLFASVLSYFSGSGMRTLILQDQTKGRERRGPQDIGFCDWSLRKPQRRARGLLSLRDMTVELRNLTQNQLALVSLLYWARMPLTLEKANRSACSDVSGLQLEKDNNSEKKNKRWKPSVNHP
ncbi:hypothetical protein MJT46_009729 [Ovis ammon polii x Ovis aries]|nr:hypothetical protein MJT46_009729 [Ovis ammon polii x Ovis aries]